MQQFFEQHRRLVLVIVGVLLVAFAALSLTAAFKNNSTTDQGVGQTSDSDQTNTFTPFSNSIFSISQNADKSVTINAPVGYQSAAVQEMYTLGMDPTNYKISFATESPFTPYE